MIKLLGKNALKVIPESQMYGWVGQVKGSNRCKKKISVFFCCLALNMQQFKHYCEKKNLWTISFKNILHENKDVQGPML